jgi:hypothetical protein|tara:strand:+ start:202 stop:786 length:585 start_codon:yes stop_codon:yes gene_type:complete
MANTTFNGPVRSEGGFEQITKNSTTGAITTNLDVDTSGNISTTGTVNNLLSVTSVTDATLTPTTAQSGTIFTLNRAAGITVTLPAAAAGLFYEFHIGTTFTGTFILQGASSSDTFQGMVFQLDKDELGSVVALNEDIDTAGWNTPAAADYRLTMDADTDGRFIGGHIRCVAITDAIWLLNGHVFGDGTVSHSFS